MTHNPSVEAERNAAVPKWGDSTATGLGIPTPTAKIRAEDLVINTSSLTVALVLAEPVLYLYGFSKTEQLERAPAMLRGSMVVRVLKPTKIKSIALEFKGTCRTEWLEGIPPKKLDTFESTELFRHGWPFFSAAMPGAELSSGAHLVQPLDAPPNSTALTGVGPSPSATTSSSDTRGRPHSSSTNEAGINVKDILLSVAQAKNRHASPSPAVASQPETQGRGYRQFQPAEYVYNFELAVPQLIAETAKSNFGHIKYHLEAHIDRPGTFKTNLLGIRDVTILRSLAMSNLDSSEPIAIARDWENLLHYEVIIAGKAFAIGGSIPIAFSLVPLDKVKCHRIRVYITEHTEYYARNKKVHRIEPSHKFLLMEKLPEDGLQGTLIHSTSSELSSATEYEFSVKIPTTFKDRHDRLHPNINSPYIKIHHWIKVVMRLSRRHPTQPDKQKSYEVSIDSPVTLVDSRTVSNNQLPVYDIAPRRRDTSGSFAFQAHKGFVESGIVDPNEPKRPIHLIRKPSMAPPPFDAELPPPSGFPPNYDETHESPQSYRRRFEEFERANGVGTDSDDQSNLSENTVASYVSSNTEPESPGVAEPERQINTEIFWRVDSDDDDGTPTADENGVATQNSEADSASESSNGNAAGPASGPSSSTPTAPATPSSRPAHVRTEILVPTAISPMMQAGQGSSNSPSMSPSRIRTSMAELLNQDDDDNTADYRRPSVTHRELPEGSDMPPLRPPTWRAVHEFGPSWRDRDPLSPTSNDPELSPTALSPLDDNDGDYDPMSSSALPPPLARMNSIDSDAPRRAGSLASLRIPSRPQTSGSMSRQNSFSRDGRRPAHSPWSSSYSRGGTTPTSESAGSSRGRYYRQSSVVSMEGGETEGRLRRWSTRVSEASEVGDWYANRRGSESSLAISISEYVGPDRNPLLNADDQDEIYFNMDYEDDAQSIRSGFYNIMTP